MQASFKEMLKTSLANSESDDDNNNICLISHEPLSENHIQLSCMHKFIYENIFNEVDQQKSETNMLETQKLKKFQFKCPYCRSIETGVLPWLAPFPKKYGINWPPSHFIKVNNCPYVFKSGKRKGSPCNCKCSNAYCTNHEKIITNRNNKNKINSFKCQAITKKGCPCSRTAKSGQFCKQHYQSVGQAKFIAKFINKHAIPTENVIISI